MSVSPIMVNGSAQTHLKLKQWQRWSSEVSPDMHLKMEPELSMVQVSLPLATAKAVSLSELEFADCLIFLYSICYTIEIFLNISNIDVYV